MRVRGRGARWRLGSERDRKLNHKKERTEIFDALVSNKAITSKGAGHQ